MCSTILHTISSLVFPRFRARVHVAERRADAEVDRKSDLLSIYISQTHESDQGLRDVIFNTLLAGRDTTGQSLTWLLYNIANSPHIEQRILSEMQQHLPRDVNFAALKQLKYLDAVINESLRLYPPVPFFTKQTLDDDVLPNGYFVPKGSLVEVSSWIMGRTLWESPLEIVPERWLSKSDLDAGICGDAAHPLLGTAKSKHPFTFTPFLAGPRRCLGIRLALLEMKIFCEFFDFFFDFPLLILQWSRSCASSASRSHRQRLSRASR